MVIEDFLNKLKKREINKGEFIEKIEEVESLFERKVKKRGKRIEKMDKQLDRIEGKLQNLNPRGSKETFKEENFQETGVQRQQTQPAQREGVQQNEQPMKQEQQRQADVQPSQRQDMQPNEQPMQQEQGDVQPEQAGQQETNRDFQEPVERQEEASREPEFQEEEPEAEEDIDERIDRISLRGENQAEETDKTQSEDQTDIPPRIESWIEEKLDQGYTPEQLKMSLEKGEDDPSLVDKYIELYGY